MHAFAGFSDRDRRVKVLLDWLLAIIVAYLLWQSVSAIWDQPESFLTFTNGRNFMLPVILTVLSIPFFYLCYCASCIEQAGLRINFKTYQSDDLKRYARRRFFLRFGYRPRLLSRAVKQFHHLSRDRGRNGVDEIVNEILANERQANTPER